MHCKKTNKKKINNTNAHTYTHTYYETFGVGKIFFSLVLTKSAFIWNRYKHI